MIVMFLITHSTGSMACPAAIACHFSVWEVEAVFMSLQGEIINKHSLKLESEKIKLIFPT